MAKRKANPLPTPSMARVDVSMDTVRRRQLGAHYTDEKLAHNVAESALRPLLDRCVSDDEVRGLSVCDPACGDGVFLAAAVRIIAQELFEKYGCSPRDATAWAGDCVFGVDIDEAAVIAARNRLGRLGVEGNWAVGDALTMDWSELTSVATLNGYYDGWSCFLGNPPFVGKPGALDSTHGDGYEANLKRLYDCEGKGKVDLCAYFFRLANRMVTRGTIGFIATNTIAQGGTRRASLQPMVAELGWEIYEATRNMPWPGDANVMVSIVHMARGLRSWEEML